MRPRFHALTVLLACLAPSGLSAAALAREDAMTPVAPDQPIPIIDFFRDPHMWGLTLNPSGSQIAGVIAVGCDRSNLFVYDLSTQSMQSTGAKGLDVFDLHWIDDRSILFRTAQERIYAWGLFLTRADKLRVVRALDRYNLVDVISIPRTKPDEPIVWMRNAAKGTGAIRVNSRRDGDTEGTLPIARSYPASKDGLVAAYAGDHAGELGYAIVSNEGRFSLLRFEDGGWKPSPIDLDRYSIEGAGDQPDDLIVSEPGTADSPGPIRHYNARTGQPGEILYRDPNYDSADTSVLRHPADGRVIGLRIKNKSTDAVWFDPIYKDVAREVAAALPNNPTLVLEGDRNDRRFLIREFSDRLEARYYLYDRAQHSLQPIGDARPWIDPQRQAETSIVRYKARDGARIEALFTLPAGASKSQPAPLVVLPHGGPWVRDLWLWDAEAQFLASRGYAVLQPNYRGSPGYGWRLPEGSDWAFRKMHEDVTDGVKAMIASGYVDGDRVAIMGSSFGGYLAICGAAFEPGVYRCAITIAGVFDWAEVMKTARAASDDSAKFSVLRRHLGDPEKQKDRFDAISPLRHSDDITIPIFIAHGREDSVASIDESKRLVRALEARQIPHEVKFASGEAHGFRHLENKVDLYTRIEAFLATHLAPRTK